MNTLTHECEMSRKLQWMFTAIETIFDDGLNHWCGCRLYKEIDYKKILMDYFGIKTSETTKVKRIASDGLEYTVLRTKFSVDGLEAVCDVDLQLINNAEDKQREWFREVQLTIESLLAALDLRERGYERTSQTT